jgi:hypothetical protein
LQQFTLSQDKVNVVVGSNNVVTFKVNQQLLEQHSAFFRNALNQANNFVESSTNTVTLAQFEPEAFEHVKRWVKHGFFKPDPNC